MILKRTDSKNSDFISLVNKLDNYLTIMDGEDHAFYDQYNKIDTIDHVIIAYEYGEAIGCGAIKHFDNLSMEVKRMYVDVEHRSKGIASAILSDLESWAAEDGYHHCILETGNRQVEAVKLYEKSGYHRIPNYGQYAGVENSLCFQKKLSI